MKTDAVEEHRMHAERYHVPVEAAEAINATRPPGRVVAVGTTTVRTLESASADDGRVMAGSAAPTCSSPRYRFKAIDAMVTNSTCPSPR